MIRSALVSLFSFCAKYLSWTTKRECSRRWPTRLGARSCRTSERGNAAPGRSPAGFRSVAHRSRGTWASSRAPASSGNDGMPTGSSIRSSKSDSPMRRRLPLGCLSGAGRLATAAEAHHERKREMKLPELTGVIERRLLVNYRVDPDAIVKVLPSPFRPQLVGDAAVAGICLLRLGSMRPAGIPAWVGLRSENAAHRVAVEWDTPDGLRTGVYIPRRDTASAANLLLGGRVYPGEHRPRAFRSGRVRHRLAHRLPPLSMARPVSASMPASPMTWSGARCSPHWPKLLRSSNGDPRAIPRPGTPHRFDGLGLDTAAWKVAPATVEQVSSSFFDDRELFPSGTATLDCALVMRDVPVRWQPLAPLHAPTHTAPVDQAAA